ncbi:iron chelate uptake ABC transporter family permease subunit [Modestobacter sp. I12A-02628]|uniref:Iron ABC transporter permease n=1 Tax=Goekera deserti TaxID=2497753 RepID=A0A7K3WA37_9ACTN|nr:iron ABC transporter permease [Goekera deserti]MPQ98891.1 iron chelate uptake ABC transporter family permease subunit [Goekera deserti]NDI49610.1 iron chelate uptake ABC transporter family permease subunit [Goekera deserti]NEL53197.1 iron ABC transporter permease [Goekera deserti]
MTATQVTPRSGTPEPPQRHPEERPRRVLRAGPLSATYRRRQLTVPVVVLALLVLVSALSIGRGDYPIALTDVLRTMVGLGDPAAEFIVLELRAPRVVVGVLVGIALGLSGALVQTFARNPLASPDVLGVTQGASVGAVAVLALGGGSSAAAGLLGGAGLPLAALVGALATAALVVLLAWRTGIDGYRLVLVGIGISAICTALTDWLLVRADIAEATAAYVWITGSLNARGWDQALPLTLALAVLLPAALVLSRTLGALQFGDDTARSLGIRVTGSQALVLLVAVALAAAAVAAAGPIQFVALVVPQIAVRLTGGSRPPLLASALLGALLVVGADLVARTVLPVALPVGIVTAVLGAPYLIWLLVSRRSRVR